MAIVYMNIHPPYIYVTPLYLLLFIYSYYMLALFNSIELNEVYYLQSSS